ncbi:UDP-glucuronosyltransferase 2C1 [Toxocara canis]|uniref:UDP-glucuronosyltransferase n=1 Tax=Toxocara canis TaxID=6265 RepID=A0A0B2VPP0_TOXCA|nr:UDP-glucuronosyltransferase 2C1 [Toxocara canis]
MGHSHMNFLGHLADTLVRAGHDVVVYTPEYDTRIKTNGTKLARVIRRSSKFTLPPDSNHLNDNAWIRDGDDISEVYYMISRISSIQQTICEDSLSDEKLLAQLRAEKFDVGISEVISSCGFGIFEKIGLKKYIAAFATNLLPISTEPFGIDNNPSYVPATFARTSDSMNYCERVENFVSTLITYVIGRVMKRKVVDKAFHKYIRPNFDVHKTIAKSTFIFVNADEFVEFPRPITHKIVYVGGIAVDPPKPLDGELRKAMDAAVGGAVLLSFGSIAQSSKMTPAMKKAFVEAFRSFPKIQFIWKYEIDDDIAEDIPNVMKRKWIPQNDLLGHPNMRAFVSHGGMNSLTESVRAGVPIVCIPLFGDQMRNAKMVEKRGVAVVLEKHNLTANAILWAFTTVLTDQSFLESSRRLAKMIAKKPFPVDERVVKYTEFAIEFGQVNNLDSAARKLNFSQYYLIDIIVPLLLILLFFIYIVAWIIIYVFRRFFNSISKSKLD